MPTISRHEQGRKCVHDKKRKNSAEADVSPPCTDNLSCNTLQNLPSPISTNCFDESPQLSALVVNCQSLVAKKASFLNLLDSYCPDIVFGCESWLVSNILNSELFSPSYNVYRQDRDDGYGGVFLACMSS